MPKYFVLDAPKKNAFPSGAMVNYILDLYVASDTVLKFISISSVDEIYFPDVSI